MNVKRKSDQTGVNMDVKRTIEQKGLNLNVKKVKTMVIGRSEGLHANIKVNGKELEQVEQFKYLGQTINKEDKSNREFETRIAQAKSMFIKLRDISLSLRFRAFHLSIPSILIYDDET